MGFQTLSVRCPTACFVASSEDDPAMAHTVHAYDEEMTGTDVIRAYIRPESLRVVPNAKNVTMACDLLAAFESDESLPITQSCLVTVNGSTVIVDKTDHTAGDPMYENYRLAIIFALESVKLS